MLAVAVQIRRYVHDAQPGWVECAFVDADGREWQFVEKVPVVTDEHLDAGSPFPRPGVIACVVVDRHRGGGRERVTVDTELPFGVASTTGHKRFEVFADQLVAAW